MKRYLEKNKTTLFLLLCYMAIVFVITQYQPGMVYQPDYSGSRIRTNFVPFYQFNEALVKVKSVSAGILGGANASRRDIIKYVVTSAYGFFANIIMFMPLGILLPMLSKKFDGLIRIGFAGFFGSLLIELGQIGVMMLFIVNKRVFDVDDLIANTIGALLGYIIYAIVRTLRRPYNPVLKSSPGRVL